MRGVVSGVAAPLMRRNVDTDAIIPSREMKRVSHEGLGEGLFANWRYSDIACIARKRLDSYSIRRAIAKQGY